ncbi:MAG: hypothetical protein LUC90_12185 [Lachnospiraceae bacterium]|nr:hypothetical protein [Lachnospiraceae bacterium]
MQDQEYDIQKICDYIDSRENSITQLWEQMVRIESPSANRTEVNRLAAHLDTYLDAMGLWRKKFPLRRRAQAWWPKRRKAGFPPWL